MGMLTIHNKQVSIKRPLSSTAHYHDQSFGLDREKPSSRREKALIWVYFTRSRYVYDTFLEHAQFLLIWHPILLLGIVLYEFNIKF